MDIPLQLFLVAIAIFLVFLNGFFVASEFSIVKVRATRIQELVRRGGRRAIRAKRLIKNMDEYLSATQLGITLASLGLGWVGEPAFARLLEPLLEGWGSMTAVVSHTLAAGLAFAWITFLHIVLGELAPKTLAIQRSERVLMWISAPLMLFYKVSYPFIWILNGSAQQFLKLLGLRGLTEEDRGHSEEELRIILAHSEKKGILDWDQKTMLEKALNFASRSVRQVMLPSLETAFLDMERSLEENLEIANTAGHTRYPLCRGSLDRVVGIVHVKDLLWKHYALGPDFSLSAIARPVQFVPENKSIKALLADFRSTRTHMAVVVDEFGSTLGVVTLEDVLEELVGQIQDEFDIGDPDLTIKKIDTDRWVAHGRCLLEEIGKKTEIVFSDQENETIGGHLMSRLGRVPRVGDLISTKDYRVRVWGMKGFQVTDVVLEKFSAESAPEGEQNR